MTPKSLQKLAAFSVARYAWCCYVDYNIETICCQMCKGSSSFQWKQVSEVGKCLSCIYPVLPNTIRNSILDSIILIDKELIRCQHNLKYLVHRFQYISWTPFFTIDRVKSCCQSGKFDINDKAVCQCCRSSYVDMHCGDFSPREMKRIHAIFGDYTEYAILYWYWYGRQNRSLLTHVFKYNTFYHQCEPLENVFKLAVFIEYEIAVFHYWYLMTETQRIKYRPLVIPLLLSESDNLEFIELNGLLPVHTFGFFWARMDNSERFEVIHYYFLDFCRYLLYHESGNSLVRSVLNVWIPSIESMEYFKLLRLAADTSNLDLFVLLWNRKLANLSFEAVGHLMWTLLLEKDVDFKLSVMIISDYEAEHKIEVLNELDKRIDTVKFDFSDRIDKFLAAASLEHLRVTGFPRNPKPRRDRMQHPMYHRLNHRRY